MLETLKKKSSHRYDFAIAKVILSIIFSPTILSFFALSLFRLSLFFLFLFFSLCLELTVEVIKKKFLIQFMYPFKQNI